MKVIDQTLLSELCAKAAASPRGRAHHNLHPSLEADIHRLVMGAQLNSYARPHVHNQTDKWELFTILQGNISILLFSPEGVVTARRELSPAGDVVAVEIPENTFHTFVVNTPDSAILEVKRGPYTPATEKDFAPWAPVEGAPETAKFLAWLKQAVPGDRAPALN